MTKKRRLSDELKEGFDALAKMRGRTWNYRVIEANHEGEISRAIHEVHYEEGVPMGYTENPASIVWEAGDEEPRRVLDRMREALDKPVLRNTDFKKQNPHIGNSFDDFLAEEGRLDEATQTALKNLKDRE